ncbi:MAG: hypothetical protein WC626_12245 [Methanoregula sp.]
MKIKSLTIVGILIIAFAAMAAPVMAASTGSDYSVITGNPTLYVSIALAGGTHEITLTPGTTTPYAGATLTVSNNGPCVISALDTMTDEHAGAKTADTGGYMVNYSTVSGTYATPATQLNSKMKLTGTVGTTAFTESDINTLSASAQPLFTSTGVNTAGVLTPSFEQAVANTDKIVPANYIYRIPITFSIAVT